MTASLFIGPDQKSRRSLTWHLHERHAFAVSRRHAPESWIEFTLEKEGAGNAGCALHPRSHAQWRVDARMSIRAQRRHPASPA